MEKVKVGVIGCGNICAIYLKNLTQVFNDIVEVTACADIDSEKSAQAAKEYGVKKSCTVEELLADREIEIVLNLTVPSVHADIAMAALDAGKHVYNEKPIAIELKDAENMLIKAKSKNLLVGNAPDTFLGGTLQTCIKLIEEGAIGKPVGATAYMLGCGPECWHPNPSFFYKKGAGPMFDMGPYYLTALINMLGPVSELTGIANISFDERTITNGINDGQKIKVEVPTYVAGLMRFKCGAVGTLTTSFDIWGENVSFIEVYGSKGVLSVPDPNHFNGSIKLKRYKGNEFEEIPCQFGYTENSRGIGLADMAVAIRNGGKHRANGDMAYHVLEIMHGFHISSETKQHYQLKSTFEKPLLRSE